MHQSIPAAPNLIVFPVNPLCSYLLIGNRVRVESSGLTPGLANAPPPGTDKAGKCPAVPQGRGGGGDWLGAAGID